jgi:hypothetical protein
MEKSSKKHAPLYVAGLTGDSRHLGAALRFEQRTEFLLGVAGFADGVM